jgi:hypothetical protein
MGKEKELYSSTVKGQTEAKGTINRVWWKKRQ